MPVIRTTEITPDELVMDTSRVIGTLDECISNPEVNGNLIDFNFYAGKCRRILLGHYECIPVKDNSVIVYGDIVNSIPVARGESYQRAVSWEELRAFLSDGWVIGTEQGPGVKIWFASTGRKGRRDPEKIFVSRSRVFTCVEG